MRDVRLGADTDASRLTRRGLLYRGALTAAFAAALPLLEACGSAAQAPAGATSVPASGSASPSAAAGGAAAPAASPAGAASAGGLQLPTYVPFQGVKPDFPPSADGIVPAGYNAFPKNLVSTSTGPVGKGEDVSFFTYSITPPPPPVSQNPAWQQVNKSQGINLKFPTVALQDYNPKFSTLIAGGDLPDMFTMEVRLVQIPNQLQFLQSQCADLTPFLAGDAVKAYPNLANFPPIAWKNCVFDGKLYALPRLTNSVGAALMVQQNLLDKIGVKEFANTDEFTRGLKALTSAPTTYGIGGLQGGPGFNWIAGVFGAPYNWRNDNGKLVKDFETPEYKEAVAYMRSLWDMGVVHPDTPTFIQQQGAQRFYTGAFAMYPSNYYALQIAWDRLLSVDPNFRLSAVLPFGHAGGKGLQFQDPGINQITVLKKGSQDRIKQVLKVLDYLASPFGSKEYLLLQYGVEGNEFNFDANGNPVYTTKGQADVQYVAWQTIISPPPVVYDPQSPGFAAVAHPLESRAHDLAITDPTIGLYSSANAEKGGVLMQKMTDGVNEIIFGRADVNSFDQLVQSWRSGGGDQIRSEYEQELQKAGGEPPAFDRPHRPA